jgi:hypothetical protein
MREKMELKRLAQAERLISECETRIAKLQNSIVMWRNAGLDVSPAEGTVLVLKDTLQLIVDHRRFILRALEDERQRDHTVRQ